MRRVIFKIYKIEKKYMITALAINWDFSQRGIKLF